MSPVLDPTTELRLAVARAAAAVGSLVDGAVATRVDGDADAELLRRALGQDGVLIAFDAHGGATGHLAVVLDGASAAHLAARLTRAARRLLDDATLDDRALDALAELGNIVVSAFLSGIAETRRDAAIPSPPRVHRRGDVSAPLSPFAGRTAPLVSFATASAVVRLAYALR